MIRLNEYAKHYKTQQRAANWMNLLYNLIEYVTIFRVICISWEFPLLFVFVAENHQNEKITSRLGIKHKEIRFDSCVCFLLLLLLEYHNNSNLHRNTGYLAEAIWNIRIYCLLIEGSQFNAFVVLYIATKITYKINTGVHKTLRVVPKTWTILINLQLI